MRIVMVLFAMFLLGCQEKTTTQKYVRPVYKIIDSLQANHLYQEAQWLMYSYYCADTVRFRIDRLKNSNITFGELRLELDTVLILEAEVGIDSNTKRSESNLIFSMGFWYDTIGCYWETVENRMFEGIAFDRYNSDEPSFVSAGVLAFLSLPVEKRPEYFKPPYPGIKAYLERVGDKANPWFRQEAIRRGVIK